MARIGIVTASEFTVQAFLLGYIARLARDHDVTVATDHLDASILETRGIRASIEHVQIARPVAPRADLAASVALLRLFRTRRFDVVYSVTPKSGLLAMGAGLVAGVPVRIHTFTGQVWATKHGAAREVFRNADRIIARCATRVLVDSPSQREFLLAEGVVSASNSGVLGCGSISGVDVARFASSPRRRQEARGELGFQAEDFVFLFVGRLNRDKGVVDLAHAFRELAAKYASARLLIVGPDEANIAGEMRAALGDAESRVQFVGKTPVPERFMAASDCFVLPSYREGFGTSVIEAACASLPAVASRIYGLTDAVVDGETGVLHAPRDVAGIRDAMGRMVAAPAIARRMGAAAHLRAARDFSAERLSEAFAEEVARLLREAGRGTPCAA